MGKKSAYKRHNSKALFAFSFTYPTRNARSDKSNQKGKREYLQKEKLFSCAA